MVRSRLQRAREQVASKLAPFDDNPLAGQGDDYGRWAGALRQCFGVDE